MSRTPLFRFLRRSLRLAQCSLRTEAPVGELVEAARERAALSRRELLAGVASAAALTAYSGCAPARVLTPRGKDDRVVIFGAGIAGLTAAYRLAQRGVSARVFDASNRTGGRIFSLRGRFAEGQVAELGGELIDANHAAIRGLGRQSLNLLLMIDPEPEPFRIFGESDERFHVRGGNDRIPGVLAERLRDHIETGTALEAIRRRADGRLVCDVRSGGASREIAADHVVLAIPFTMLRNVRLDLDLSPFKRRAIDELGYGTNAKLIVGFSERVWRTRHRSNGSVVTDLPFQATWETSRLQPGRSGILTNFTGGDHGVELGRGTAGEQAGLLVADLERVFPGISAARPGMTEARFHWPSYPLTKGSYAGYLPGQWTGFRGVEAEPAGSLHFAGEHCSLTAQGFMEGGCETGEAVAREVLADLGLAPAAAAA